MVTIPCFLGSEPQIEAGSWMCYMIWLWSTTCTRYCTDECIRLMGVWRSSTASLQSSALRIEYDSNRYSARLARSEGYFNMTEIGILMYPETPTHQKNIRLCLLCRWGLAPKIVSSWCHALLQERERLCTPYVHPLLTLTQEPGLHTWCELISTILCKTLAPHSTVSATNNCNNGFPDAPYQPHE